MSLSFFYESAFHLPHKLEKAQNLRQFSSRHPSFSCMNVSSCILSWCDFPTCVPSQAPQPRLLTRVWSVNSGRMWAKPSVCAKCHSSARAYYLSESILWVESLKMSFQSLTVFYVFRRTSLELCARVSSGQPRVLGVCQLGALQCLGRSFTLVNDNECDWPEGNNTSGTKCQRESGIL